MFHCINLHPNLLALGDLCKCCSETGRRAYPKMKREALISSLEAGGNFLVEFSESHLFDIDSDI